MMTSEKIFITRSEKETRTLGNNFGKNIIAGLIVLLYGDLGTGKTVFVKGVGDAMDVSGVRSPSFTLINEYESLSGIFLIHSDLYRLDENGVNSLCLEEYAGADDSVLFVEWSERIKNENFSLSSESSDNPAVIKIFFKALNENEREIKIIAYGKKAQEVIIKL